MGDVSRPTGLVVPISLYQTTGQLWYVLRKYKDSPDAQLRQRFTLQIAATLSRFLRLHEGCIAAAAGRPWQGITLVPPSHEREGPQPLEGAVNLVPALRGQYVRTLRTVVPRVPRLASDEAYEVVTDVGGLDLLVIDDTFTTGASIQSAASALQLAGANVVGAVVVGRVINPEFTPETKALWAKARELPFRFETCCVSSP
jgi:predicted amidophosphoribosyltransferase